MASNTDKIISPGTAKGPTQSASPRSIREGNADPKDSNHRGTGGKEDLLRPMHHRGK